MLSKGKGGKIFQNLFGREKGRKSVLLERGGCTFLFLCRERGSSGENTSSRLGLQDSFMEITWDGNYPRGTKRTKGIGSRARLMRMIHVEKMVAIPRDVHCFS